MKKRLLAGYCLMVSVSTVFAADPWYYGKWAVKGSEVFGVSAMTTAEARSWYGSIARYSADSAKFREDQCAQPSYRTTRQSAADFFEYYRFAATELGIDSDTVETVGIGCPERWDAPGSSLIRVDSDTAFTSWDGVYFKLERQ